MNLEYHNDHLTLKILNESNASEVLDFYQRNQAWFDLYEPEKPNDFYTEAFINKILRAETKAFLDGTHVRLFLYDTLVSDNIIGTISFSNIKNLPFRSCCIGYKIDKKYQRHGYGRKMLTMALKIMVIERGMHRIDAYISPENEASIALATRLGFINEGTAYAYVQLHGTWQDHLHYVYIS
jgi:ribosomal-protein-alanine N-acetyltransferase